MSKLITREVVINYEADQYFVFLLKTSVMVFECSVMVKKKKYGGDWEDNVSCLYYYDVRRYTPQIYRRSIILINGPDASPAVCLLSCNMIIEINCVLCYEKYTRAFHHDILLLGGFGEFTKSLWFLMRF